MMSSLFRRMASGLAACFLLVTEFSGTGAELQLGSGAAAPSSTVAIPVTFQAGTAQAVAAQFDVNYDSTRLRAEGVVLSPALAGWSVASREIKPGTRRVVLYSPASASMPSDTLLNIPFTLPAGTSSGGIKLTFANVLVSDRQGARVNPVTLVDGSVTISGGSGGGTGGARFTAVQFDNTGVLHLDLSTTSGKLYILQNSPDLRSWNGVSTNAAAGGLLRLTDPNPLRQSRSFYRALQIP